MQDFVGCREVSGIQSSVRRSAVFLVSARASMHLLHPLRTRTCTAYVLSESSLFVFENSCIFKTCGRTLLLKAIPLVLDLLKRRGLQLEYVLYTSKNYLFPDSQLYPHTSWEESVCPNFPIIQLSNYPIIQLSFLLFSCYHFLGSISASILPRGE